MELHIKERLLIPSVFPEKNSFMDFNLKKSIISKLAITDKDKKDYEIVENKEANRVEWNIQKDMETPLVIDFTKEEMAYMVKSCEAISEQSMPDEMWAIVEHIYNESNDIKK